MRISDWSSDVCSSDLVGRALARKFAQAAERDLDVAGAEFLGVVEILELALFPDLQRALVLALAADPHALGVITRIPTGARAACADPLAAALVALRLFLEPPFPHLHHLVPVPARPYPGHSPRRPGPDGL